MTKAKFFDDVTIDKVLDAYKRLDYPLFVFRSIVNVTSF